MKIYYTIRAKRDVDLAYEWYESQHEGLGTKFLNSIETSLSKITSYPDMYPILFQVFHRCLIKTFPFSVFYTKEKNKIIIHAVFDNRLDPEKRP